MLAALVVVLLFFEYSKVKVSITIKNVYSAIYSQTEFTNIKKEDKNGRSSA
jgi:hypothetical protein